MGVKNGINAFGKKNYLGTFAPPFAVINDVSFLETLPDRHWRAGVSEADQGRAHQGSGVLRLPRGARRRARGARSRGDGAGDPALRRAAPVAHRERRRSVRARLVTAARLRPLVGAQARTADRPPAEPRRSGGDRDRARHARTPIWRVSCPRTTGGGSSRCCRRCGLSVYVPELGQHLDARERSGERARAGSTSSANTLAAR